ncbi:MAG: acyltransferase family protein [Deltaproteobacteria bacterium]|nr:acyltransferase family protein [Deltaproteobacteria bacterium]
MNTHPDIWLKRISTLFAIFERVATMPVEMLEKLERTLPESSQKRLQELHDKAINGPKDPFGMDFGSIRSALAVTSFFYTYYFRCKTSGLENVPPGPIILAANHAGQLPIDAVMVNTALFLEADPPMLCRSMMDKLVPTLPVISNWYNRLGVVLGTPDNAKRLLDDGQKLLTFPEGVTGIQKPISKAYELQKFGLGFIRLALKNQTPVIPVAIVGSEEQYPTLYNVRRGTHLLNVPSLPVWLQMPIPFLGLLPLPVRYYIHFGEPLTFKGDPDDDDEVINEMAVEVKNKIDAEINRLREQRKGIFK